MVDRAIHAVGSGHIDCIYISDIRSAMAIIIATVIVVWLLCIYYCMKQTWSLHRYF